MIHRKHRSLWMSDRLKQLEQKLKLDDEVELD
jgi:hypothetical protein